MNGAGTREIPASARRLLVLASLMTTYLQGANVSIPNAALSQIQGSISMADDEIGWLFTSYIAASVVVAPMTLWLAGRFGRKLVFQVSIVVFALGLVLDTFATNPIEIVLARSLQGAAGGPLVPLSIAILLEVVSPARRAWASLAVAACILLGISSGPAIGGWLSEYHGWPSIFYFSLPIAAFIFLVMELSLTEKKAAQKPTFDFFGFAGLTLGIMGLQMMLDRGERLEWFDSTEIWVEAVASVIGFYVFIVHVVTMKTHFCDKGLLRDRNFVLSTVVYFGVGFALLPTLALTSPMLNELLNYPVPTTGYATIPRGIALVGTLVLTGFIPKRIDNRWLALGGLALVAYANWRMLAYSPWMHWRTVVIAGMLQGAGLAISIAALTKTAFSTLDVKLHPEANAIFSLTRLYGSTIGIAVVQLFFYGNTQAMHQALAKDMAPYRAAAHLPGVLSKAGLARLNDMITGQSAVVAVIGQFKVLLLAILIVIPFVFFLRKPNPA